MIGDLVGVAIGVSLLGAAIIYIGVTGTDWPVVWHWLGLIP